MLLVVVAVSLVLLASHRERLAPCFTLLLTLSVLIKKGVWAGGLRPVSSSFVAGTGISAPIQGSRFEALHLNCVN